MLIKDENRTEWEKMVRFSLKTATIHRHSYFLIYLVYQIENENENKLRRRKYTGKKKKIIKIYNHYLKWMDDMKNFYMNDCCCCNWFA